MGVFHRYSSTIHGNYRQAYLKCGLLTGLLMAAYILVRYLMGSATGSPHSYVIDAIILVCIFLLSAYYRNSLPDKKVSLKELMLFGIGLSAVASLVYGLSLWLIGTLLPEQTVLFTTTMTGKETTIQDPQLHYWTAWWALFATMTVLLQGAFASFLAALFFRTEKSEIKKKQ